MLKPIASLVTLGAIVEDAIKCQDLYFHTLTVDRQCNMFLILLCSSGLALGLRPLLSSLARAILTGIQSISAVLPLHSGLWFSCFLVCSSRIFCEGLLDGSGVR
jgi:hypothetical protein